jgi:hypothetical protein
MGCFCEEVWFGLRRKVVSLRDDARDCEEFLDDGGAMLDV